MRHILLIPDGAADRPRPELAGGTPLRAARLPHFDRLAREGQIGLVQNVADGYPPGSDVACLGLLGYHPGRIEYTGRAALEAAARGVVVPAGGAVFRANFVTAEDGRMADHSAGHLSGDEGAALIDFLGKNLALDGISLHAGVGYRHLCVIADMAIQIPATTPPHDIVGRQLNEYAPRGGFSSWVLEVERTSAELLADHPINRKRRAEGKRPASQLWLWAGSTPMTLPLFAARYGREGAMITAVDLLRGIARLAGMEVIDVPGATGFLDTHYAGKGKMALEALERTPFVAVHVEAPDEAGHAGDAAAKIRALENIDSHILAPLLDESDRTGDIRIAASPDHPTPLELRTHSSDPVPFALWGAGIPASGVESYDEVQAAAAWGGAEPLGCGDLLRRLLAE